MSYYEKYLKYKKKCEKMEDIINVQNGGKSDVNRKDNINIEDYINKLKKIEKKVKDKGTIFWFDTNGRLLSKGTLYNTTKKEIVKKIKKDKNKWNDETLCRINIKFNADDLMNKKTGGIDISVDVNKVYIDGNFLSINQKNKDNSLLRLFYRYDELDDFKLTDMKKIALIMINLDMKKVNALKFYHYCDIKKYLDQY